MDFLSTQIGKVIGIAASALIGSIPIVLAAADQSLVSVNWEGMIGLLVQAGALGIVALLLMHVMPAERKAQREMYAEMRQAIKDQAEEHKEAIKAQVEAHKEAIKVQVETHAAIAANMISTFEKHDEAWRELLSRKCFSPIAIPENHHK